MPVLADIVAALLHCRIEMTWLFRAGRSRKPA